MVCRNCGSTIPEGKLYCPFCGEEVQLVPEYTSADMERVIRHLEEAELAREERRRELEAEAREKEKRMKPGTKALCMVLIAALSAALTLCMHLWIARNNHANFGYLRTQAARAEEAGDLPSALQYLIQAEAVMPSSSVDIPLKKSDLLWKMGRNDNAEAVLYDLLTRCRTVEVYSRLFRFLEEDGDYAKIAALLKSSESDELKTLYGDYLAEPPEMSLMNGSTYSYGTKLSLFSKGKGAVYYTTDGSDPDETASLYTEPLLLDVGTNRIRAVFINEKGIASDITEAVFTVRKAAFSSV